MVALQVLIIGQGNAILCLNIASLTCTHYSPDA